MQKGNRLNYITAVILAVLVCFAVIAVSGIGGKAYAASSKYSDALDDLNKDTSFNSSAYPIKATDYSLQVIQIAESKDGELFIYVYQPSGQAKNLTATTVRLSTAINDNAKWSDYSLTKINSNGVFYKYKVEEITLKTDVVRYYDITAIHRKWESAIDKGTGNDNTIDEVVYEVGQLWTAVTLNGEVSYSMTTAETITVTDKYVDFLRYPNGWLTYQKATDSHYIAFNTDKPIEKLVEADVYFVSQEYRFRYDFFGNYKEVYAWEPEEHTETLNYEYDFGGNSATGLFSQKYEWECVQSISEFKSSIEADGLTLSEETETNLKNKKWVLRFYESEFYDINREYYATRVNDVTILRLKFETAGKVYNLGVVDNKQSGDLKPGNDPEAVKEDGFFEYLWNCIKHLFQKTATTSEIIVAVVAIVAGLFVLGCAIGFIKWFWRKVFK